MPVCYICDSEDEYLDKCKSCDALICPECNVPFTQHSQIDFTLCIYCGERSQY